MVLLTFDDEYARAREVMPFSNGFEGESWASLWCYLCIHYQDCPLLSVAMMGRTPAAWEVRDPWSLNRYTCHEHDDVNHQKGNQ